MTFIFLLKIFVGLVIASRTIAIIERANIIAIDRRHQLRFLFLNGFVPILVEHWTSSLIAFLVVSVVQLLLPLLLAWLVENRRILGFRSEVHEFYDELIFAIRGGQSLRSVLTSVRDSSHFGFYTREMVSRVLSKSGSGGRSAEIEERVVELQLLLQSSGRILERIHFYRRRHLLEEKFRRKSRTATQQVRAQTGIVCLMYIILLFLQLWTGLLNPTSPWIWISACLLLAGTLALFLVMRSFRWKV